MLPLRFSVLCVVLLLAVGLNNVNCVSDEERSKIFSALIPTLAECGKEYSKSEEDIKTESHAGKLNPCLIKCILTKIKVIDSNGFFNPERAQELSAKYLTDPEDRTAASGVIKTCSTVNDKNMGDGTNSCDRAKMLFDCFMPYKQTFL